MKESKQSIKESIGQWRHCGPAETLPHEDSEATGGTAPVQVVCCWTAAEEVFTPVVLQGFCSLYLCNFEYTRLYEATGSHKCYTMLSMFFVLFYHLVCMYSMYVICVFNASIIFFNFVKSTFLFFINPI